MQAKAARRSFSGGGRPRLIEELRLAGSYRRNTPLPSPMFIRCEISQQLIRHSR
jgi:hypothetical protein